MSKAKISKFYLKYQLFGEHYFEYSILVQHENTLEGVKQHVQIFNVIQIFADVEYLD